MKCTVREDSGGSLQRATNITRCLGWKLMITLVSVNGLKLPYLVVKQNGDSLEFQDDLTSLETWTGPSLESLFTRKRFHDTRTLI